MSKGEEEKDRKVCLCSQTGEEPNVSSCEYCLIPESEGDDPEDRLYNRIAELEKQQQ